MLTDDELIVLEIAAEGKTMLAIGRWERPTKYLTELGFMRQLDATNYDITHAGRVALARNEQDVAEALIRLNKWVDEVKASALPPAVSHPLAVPSDEHTPSPERQNQADVDTSASQSEDPEFPVHEASGEGG